MKTLSTEHRRQLERTVIGARDVAEAGARGALEALAVHHHEPYGHMSGEQRRLRNRLRAHARHRGDRVDARTHSHTIDHLVHECAYEHWHGMLLARFLAENHLLIEPEIGVSVTLDDCEELAREEGVDKWALAARFAHRMLPQVFRPDHPVFEVQFTREYRLKLEGSVEGLPAEVFTATDALGWVYQFWQTKKKDEVNRSEVKIGADELPAVTQLFTEPYMVKFLLHNSLGAWWVSRHPDKECPVDLTYLRRTEDGAPAAGAFDGWPDNLSQFRLLDPCCGSGHFLVAAFLMLVPMRMALEGLNPAEAVDAVLRQNIHGLELDQRCVAIAAFALALEAWRCPDAGGFRTLPKLNLAWCGQPVAGKKEQWLALAEGDPRLEAGMTVLYDTFRDAPTLGSLIDPVRSVSEDMLTAGFDELQPLLEKALRKHAGEEEWEETAIAALGLSQAARLLCGQFTLVVTNVPFLTQIKFTLALDAHISKYSVSARANLATAMISRMRGFVSTDGAMAFVAPQSWWFLKRYAPLRFTLLQDTTFVLLARLGENAFESPQAGGELVGLSIIFERTPSKQHDFCALDVSETRETNAKAEALKGGLLEEVSQGAQLKNNDAIVTFSQREDIPTLGDYCTAYFGSSAGDRNRFVRKFWEVPVQNREVWEFHQTSPAATAPYQGREEAILWEKERGQMYELAESVKHLNHKAQQWRSGKSNWGKSGVAVSLMNPFPATLYAGDIYDTNCCTIVPSNESDLLALWAFCSSSSFRKEVRMVNQNRKVEVRTILSIPFDKPKWEEVARRKYEFGLPSPMTKDPTQWLFGGDLSIADHVLHVGVARLVGYRWPRQRGRNFFDCKPIDFDGLEKHCHSNGIACLNSVRGERPAAERLLLLLHAAYGDDWHDGILAKLLAEPGSASLDDWLRDIFFEEHCKLFQHRPFIWHIWDGRKRDGFHALVNYHKLAEGDGKGRHLLESLTYSYLGDWIARQQDGVKRGEGGAEDRLAAALELQKRLVAILEGQPPFDVFVRWKPIEQQPIGWEPDINDGVRLNIRPFMAQDLPGGKKGAGILRAKPNIHWKKDRGKEPIRDQAQFPWFWKNGTLTGERVNDVHLTDAEKRAAREPAGTAATRK